LPETIFISHSSKDGAISNLLEQFVVEVFGDKTFKFFNSSNDDSIEIGDDWQAKIKGALKEARIFIALLTPNSIGSAWVHFETGGAWITDNFDDGWILPCYTNGLTVSDFPSTLKFLQSKQITSANDLNQIVQKLDQIAIQGRANKQSMTHEVCVKYAALFAELEENYLAAKQAEAISETPEDRVSQRIVGALRNPVQSSKTTSRNILEALNKNGILNQKDYVILLELMLGQS